LPQRLFETVRYVVEALVIVPLVPQNVGRVAYVVEAFVAVRLVTFPVVPQNVGRVA